MRSRSTHAQSPFTSSSRSFLVPPERNQESSDPWISVIISWGNSVLHVAYVEPNAGFSLGTPRFKGDHIDFEADEELIGCSWLSTLFVDESQAIYVVIPDGATGEVIQGATRVSLADLKASAQHAPGVEGAFLQRLGQGLSVELNLGRVQLHLALTTRAAAFPTGFLEQLDRDVPLYFGASAALFLSLMGSLAFFAPPLGIEDESTISRERLFLISQYLDAASEREQKKEPEPSPESGSDGGTAGQRAQGSEGKAGKENQLERNKQAAVKGPKDNPELQLSRAELLDEVRTSGMIGLLSGSLSESSLAHPIFGRDETLGNSDLTAQGNMWGDELGESAGMNGLGLAGDGFGGGDLLGNGLGIGTSAVGTIGVGTGRTGFGTSRGLPQGQHGVRGISLRTVGNTEVSGRLPAQVIQRVVRQNFGRFRMCYEQGLGRSPQLEGRVSVRFIIGNDGIVSAVSAAGDLPDQVTKSCVASAFYGISFPAPEGGVVKVSYPLMFSPQ